MYESGAAFWSKAVFMAELIVAELLMTAQLKRRPLFALRAIATLIVLFGAAIALPSINGALYSSLSFISMFLLTVAGIYFCYAESLRTVSFCALAGYATQHIAYELFDMIITLMGLGNARDITNAGSNSFATFITMVNGSGGVRVGNMFIYIMYIATYFLTYWLVCRITSPRLKNIENIQLENNSALIVIALTVVFDIVISSIVSEYGSYDYNKQYILLLDLTNMFCCILVLYQQFSLAKMHRMSDDLSTVNRMLEQSEKQYSYTKESIDLINMQVHDFKHQLHKIGTSNELSPAAVGEIMQAVAAYDTNVKTGNPALDIILTEKSIFCNRHGIALSCIADGKQLDFMTEPDIYTLFGNILDNAIEAVVELEPDKQAIGLTVKRVNDFVFINENNYYGDTIALENGLPQTTKTGAYHGYGMKSIKLLTEKYNGEFAVNTDNGVFNLNIIFPIAAEDKD